MAEEIAILLRKLLELRGITKYRLAKLSGIKEAYISQLLSGKVNNPRRDTLNALAEGFKVPPCIFFGEDLEDMDIKYFLHGEIEALDSENKDLLRHSINIVRERVKENDKYKSGG